MATTKATTKRTPRKAAAEVITPGPVVQVKEPSESEKFLMAIHQAAADPNVDMDKMDRLYQMAKDIKTEEAKVAYNRNMALCQGEMPIIEKKHLNNQTSSQYAKVEDILRVIKPIYTKYGFSVQMYPMEAPDGMVKVGCDVAHAEGHEKHFEDTDVIDNKGIAGKVNKTQIHGRGSAKTYLERSLLSLAFALEIGFKEDDDGNKAGEGEELYITDDQIKEIEDLIETYGLNRDHVLELCKSGTGIPELSSIKQAEFGRFWNILTKKARAKKAADDQQGK